MQSQVGITCDCIGTFFVITPIMQPAAGRLARCAASALLVLSLTCPLSVSAKDRDTVMEGEKLSASIAEFSAQFCNNVEGEGSTVSSPLSAEFILALLALGTSGTAHDEILAALKVPSDDFIRKEFTAVSKKLTDVKGVTFNIANKVYLKEGDYSLKAEFKRDAEQVFAAEVDKINFADSAAAASTINSWVESRTNKRIKDLLKPDSLSDDTRLVLVNALYFKGSWKDRFDANHTQNLPFHLDSKRTIDVPTMRIEKNFKYGESAELDAKLLELPYEGGEASMLVVLPNQVDGLPALVAKLAAGADLLAAANEMRSTKVRVQLPKFKIETEIDLKTLLPKLGIKRIFDSSSNDIDGLLDTPQPLYVSQAVQKAFIEVNEEGAEAAAATAGVGRLKRSLASTPVTFHVRWGALYYILVRGVPLMRAQFSPRAPPAPSAPHSEL